jgi:hypothetical protein
VQMVAKTREMSIRILVSPNSSGLKYLGKSTKTLNAPIANPT